MREWGGMGEWMRDWKWEVGGNGKKSMGGMRIRAWQYCSSPSPKKIRTFYSSQLFNRILNYPTASSISSGYEVSKKNRKQNVKLHRLYADADADANAVRLCLVH